MYARHALMTATRPDAGAEEARSLAGAVAGAVLPPVLLAVELGSRGWPSASAGPTVDSGASGDGGKRCRGRPPPFDSPVNGENIAAVLVDSLINGVCAFSVATDERNDNARVTDPRA